MVVSGLTSRLASRLSMLGAEVSVVLEELVSRSLWPLVPIGWCRRWLLLRLQVFLLRRLFEQDAAPIVSAVSTMLANFFIFIFFFLVCCVMGDNRGHSDYTVFYADRFCSREALFMANLPLLGCKNYGRFSQKNDYHLVISLCFFIILQTMMGEEENAIDELMRTASVSVGVARSLANLGTSEWAEPSSEIIRRGRVCRQVYIVLEGAVRGVSLC